MRKPRRLCLDVMRGFCLWNSFIMTSIGVAALQLPGSPIRDLLLGMYTHSDWNGFHFVDDGFPAYMMLIGISMAFSHDRQLREGKTKAHLWKRLWNRVAIFLVFAFFYQGGFSHTFGHMVFDGTFFKLAFSMLISGVALLTLSWRGQVVALAVFLLAHWALIIGMAPAGDVFPQTGNWEVFLSEQAWSYFPDRLGLAAYPELAEQFWWWFFLPKIAGTALVGPIVARFLMDGRTGAEQLWRIARIGVFAMLVALAWDRWLPINKLLWTPSYTLFSGGFACMVLVLSMLFTETIRTPHLTKLLVVYGRHPLMAWVWNAIVLESNYAQRFIGEGFPLELGVYHAMAVAVVQLAICWLPMVWMYNIEQKIRPATYQVNVL